MTPDQQNRCIAEACGWTKVSESGYAHLKRLSGIKPGAMRVVHQGEYIDSFSDVPDYLNDLNAMAEAEKALTPEQFDRYADILCDYVSNGGIDPDIKGLITLTAKLRVESFLMAIGKWVVKGAPF